MKRLSWQAKAALTSAILVLVIRIAFIFALLPAYNAVGQSDKTAAENTLDTSQTAVHILIILTYAAIASAIIFTILELIRRRNNP